MKTKNQLIRLVAGGLALSASLAFAQSNTSPVLTISGVSITEGNAGTQNANFALRLSRVPVGVARVTYATANGTATAGSDYLARSGTVTFASNTVATISVPVVGDTVVESNETFYVNLSGASGLIIGSKLAVGTIVNDDAAVIVPPTLTISDVSISEGNSGTQNANFTLRLSRVPVGVARVSYATANGTAAAGSDYLARSGTVTFASNTVATISVPVVGDAVVESDETFYVNLAGAAGLVIGDNQGAGTILNDDSAIIVPVAKANVRISGLSFTPDLGSNKVLRVVASLQNNGTASLENVGVALWGHLPALSSNMPKPDLTFIVPGLGTGQVVSVTRYLPLPGVATSYMGRAFADYENKIAETSEIDNHATAPYVVGK